MAIAIDIMKAGISAVSAQAINGQVNSSITAGTTQTQAGATALSKSVNVITTVTTSGDGVVLTDSSIGDSYDILNIGGNPCSVYPPSGGRINGLPTDTDFTLANNTAVRIQKFTATRWFAFLSA